VSISTQREIILRAIAALETASSGLYDARHWLRTDSGPAKSSSPAAVAEARASTLRTLGDQTIEIETAKRSLYGALTLLDIDEAERNGSPMPETVGDADAPCEAPDTTDTRSVLEFGVPRMHYESVDSWSFAGCMEWRAELRLSDLDAPGGAPEVGVGVVQFLILRAGYESPREVLALYGDRAATFAELFDDDWLVPDLDESDDFTAGMPISTVLLVLDASMDVRLSSESLLRAWAVAETVHTMLPTTSGLVVMPALPAAVQPTRRLLSVDQIDPDCARVGCMPIPGHPRFYGQATAYVYLDEARGELAHVQGDVFRIAVQD
jgi:hypothetical protein